MTDIDSRQLAAPVLERPPPTVVSMKKLGSFGVNTVAIGLSTSLIAFLAWFLITWFKIVPSLFLPSPGEVTQSFLQIWQNGYANASLSEHISASLYRILSAGLIAFSAGVPIGLWMGLNRWAKGILSVPIDFYWPLPPLSYLPLMIIWLGIGEASKITILSLAMFAPIVMSAQAGVRSVAPERFHAILSLGANRRQLLWDLILPSALPEILTGLRIAFGIGWSTLIAAELIAATRGIGYMIISASHFLATDVVFVGIAIIAILASLFTASIKMLERALVPWKDR